MPQLFPVKETFRYVIQALLHLSLWVCLCGYAQPLQTATEILRKRPSNELKFVTWWVVLSLCRGELDNGLICGIVANLGELAWRTISGSVTQKDTSSALQIFILLWSSYIVLTTLLSLALLN